MSTLRRIATSVISAIALIGTVLGAVGVISAPAYAASPSWTASTLPLPTGDTEGSANAVSCPASGSCVAVGTSGTASTPTAWTLISGTWSMTELP